MRLVALAGLCLIAACSEAEAPKAATEEKASELRPGQWEMTTEVTQFTAADKGKPAVDTPVGTKASVSGCIGAGEGKRPPAPLLAGTDDQCTYKNIYMSNGRVVASIGCTREGLRGDLGRSVEGNFTAESIDATVSLETSLFTDGDVRVAHKLTGRRVGECTAGAGGASNSAEAR